MKCVNVKVMLIFIYTKIQTTIYEKGAYRLYFFLGEV